MNPGAGLLRKARKRRGLTMAQAAEKVGVPVTAVSHAELSEWPTTRNLARYAGPLGYDVRVILVDRTTGDTIS